MRIEAGTRTAKCCLGSGPEPGLLHVGVCGDILGGVSPSHLVSLD